LPFYSTKKLTVEMKQVHKQSPGQSRAKASSKVHYKMLYDSIILGIFYLLLCLIHANRVHATISLYKCYREKERERERERGREGEREGGRERGGEG